MEKCLEHRDGGNGYAIGLYSFTQALRALAYSDHYSTIVLVTNQNCISKHWLISDQCSTTFNFYNPKIFPPNKITNPNNFQMLKKSDE